METPLVNAALALYFGAGVLGVLFLLGRSRALFRIAVIIATGAFAALFFAMLLRWLGAGRPPLSNMYESLLFFSWAVWLVVLVLILPRRMDGTAVLSIFLPVVCLGYAAKLDPSIRPLMPALRSNWLVIHVATSFLGYAGFAAAFFAGLGLSAALLRGSAAEKWQRAATLSMRFGFLFLTYGILTGSVWANEAWTIYWGWDPKETWALLTWIFYFMCLVAARRGRGEGEKPVLVAFASIGGFLFVLFTYLGVSFLLRGLHSYL